VSPQFNSLELDYQCHIDHDTHSTFLPLKPEYYPAMKSQTKGIKLIEGIHPWI